MVMQLVKALFGTANEREIKRVRPIVARINELEPKVSALSNDGLRAQTARFRERVANGEHLDTVLPEAFACVREAGKRVLNMRHFDVQLIGGYVLHRGRIAEMRTGEGKTLVSTLPAYLNALAGKGVHIVTVNDYLAQRDAEWMGRIHRFLGLTVGCVVHGLTDKQRRDAYHSDITYGHNSEFGFDYLRDNMKGSLKRCVQRDLHYAIVDEVDSILIDEARTPLIISGPTNDRTDLYYKVDAIIPQLARAPSDEEHERDQGDYYVDEKSRHAYLTESGVNKCERLLGVKNLYDPSEIELLHFVYNALRAHTCYIRDVQYVVRDDKVYIVDEFTGRIMEGRRWSDGLHQAVEAKERVPIENESQTLATISYQNYFRMYGKLGGMTGTAETEAEEFAKIYDIDVVVIPTNRPMIRRDFEDVIYKTEAEKNRAIAEEIKDCYERGQPALVGTVSIEKSEQLSGLLRQHGIPHNVLNAKHHEREAEIVAQAGRSKSVTIATNMAGRGTDILLGGNPEFLAKREIEAWDREHTGPEGNLTAPPEEQLAAHQGFMERYAQDCARDREAVLAAGGLHIIGTERHESRRIDNQLRGRAGRQGDPGSSRFFLSLEDDLMRIFGGDRLKGWMNTLGLEDDVPIEHSMVSRSIRKAQERVEGRNFDIRKNLLEYDDVMNQQRKAIYSIRRAMLLGEATHDAVLDLLEDFVIDVVNARCPDPRRHEDWDLAGIGQAIHDTLGTSVGLATTERDIEKIQLHIYGDLEAKLLEKQGLLSAEVMARLEREIYLQVLDAHWKEHLLAMDHLKEGIHLRGYGARDPKNEYKKEGFNMFKDLLLRIRQDILGLLFRMEVKREEEVAAMEQKAQEKALKDEAQAARAVAAATVAAADAPPPKVGEAPRERGAPASAKPQTVRRAEPKIGRNDPCWCGSGKKYKLCHGRPGAHPE